MATGQPRPEDTQRDASLSGKTVKSAEQIKQASLERAEAVRESTQGAKQRAAERVRKVGTAMRKVGEHLRIEEQTYVADKATDVSQRVDAFANYLDGADVKTLLQDTSALARKSPAAFFGSAFVVGLAAGRFLRSGTPSGGSVSGSSISGSSLSSPRASSGTSGSMSSGAPGVRSTTTTPRDGGSS